MPVHRLPQPPDEDEDYHRLVDELAREYKLGDKSTNAEPSIYLEPAGIPNVLHVYVVWEKWRHLSESLRSQIIMDALELAMPPEDLLKVALAWGMTPRDWEGFRPAAASAR